jgi:hypothetical protein
MCDVLMTMTSFVSSKNTISINQMLHCIPVESMPMPTITPLLNSSSINAASNVSTVNQTYVSSPNFDFSVSAGSESHSHQFYVNPMPQREVVGHLLLDQSRNKKKKRRKKKTKFCVCVVLCKFQVIRIIFM